VLFIQGAIVSQTYKYFTVPFDSIPKDPKCTVWYATWSTERPEVKAGSTVVPWVICATPNAEVAAAMQGTLVGTVTKDPPLPPPLQLSPTNAALSDYLGALTDSLNRRDA
jgi:hypothetical protein